MRKNPPKVRLSTQPKSREFKGCLLRLFELLGILRSICFCSLGKVHLIFVGASDAILPKHQRITLLCNEICCEKGGFCEKTPTGLRVLCVGNSCFCDGCLFLCFLRRFPWLDFLATVVGCFLRRS